jgi:uncharacterized protein YdaU (DUF1376 family)
MSLDSPRKPLPYYPLYVNDFDESHRVLAMNLAEVGLYLLALNESWKRGSIPDDPRRVAMLIRKDAREVQKAWPVVRACFMENGAPGRLVNLRQETERAKALSKSLKATSAVESRYQESILANGNHAERRANRMAEARAKGRHTRSEWEALLLEFGGRCLKCGASSADREIVKDHITPIYQGGDDSIENIQPLCTPCNSGKGPDRTNYVQVERLRIAGLTPTQTPSKHPARASESESSEDFNKENHGYALYHELPKRWGESKVGIDLGMQVWISLVDSGEITEANVHEVFEGLERWKNSELWAKENGRYIPAIANPQGTGWLQKRAWKDYPKQAVKDSW